MNDSDLLRQYTEQGSQEAFGALVTRYLNLVFSAARRQVRSEETARDVAQVVFFELSLNARRLRPDTYLGSWLYVVTRRTAIDMVRRETRRAKREQAAAEIAAMKSSSSDWSQIGPCLDAAVASLDESDRTAILLRYFEAKNLREIGAALNLSDDAAQKRVSRAIERLRVFLAKRGVTASAMILAADLVAHGVEAAPAGLGATVAASVAFSQSATHQVALLHTAKALTMTTTQKSFAAALLAVAIGGGFWQWNVIENQDAQIAHLRLQGAQQAEQLRLAHLALADAPILQRTPASGVRSAEAVTTQAGSHLGNPAIDSKNRLQILEDLQKRNLLKSNMTFITPKGRLGPAFVELFSLQPDEAATLQTAVDEARKQIGDLKLANASVRTSGDHSIEIEVKPFDGGSAVYDNLTSVFANTLGNDRFASFVALGANQVQDSLGNFGAQLETISITNESPGSPPNEGQYMVLDTRKTAADQTISLKTVYPNLDAVTGTFGPVTQLLPKKF